MLRKSLLLLGLAGAGALLGATQNLEIYWIDAEGGASTLIVTPSGESVLIDTANRTPDDRDAKRIAAAAQLAGVKKIDILVTSHYHGDHIGAMPALVKLMPVGQFMDHGDSVESNIPSQAAAYQAYAKLAEGKRKILKPGDRIPLNGVNLQVVMSNGEPLATPLKGAGKPNPACADFQAHPPDASPENNQSVGVVLSYGKFKFVDLGDLTWNFEQKMICPVNKIGKVDLYQVSHHGLDRSNSPQLVQALQPTVAVMNNGPRKGGVPSVFETLRKSPGLEDIWQVHLALNGPKEVNTDERMIANMEPTEECKGNLLKVSVARDGKFTVTNLRNNFSKTYQSK